MYLKYVNILCFIILTYLCFWICALDIGMEQYRLFTYKGSNDCILPLPRIDNEMPLIYDPETNLTIYPNRQGHIVLKYNTTLRMSCAGNYFVAPIFSQLVKEISIKCINRHLLQYNGVDHPIDNYRCFKVPSPIMVNAKRKCQVDSGEVLNVGFETDNKYLILYRICFDMKNKSPLYSWYHATVPMYRYIQNTTTTPSFIKTNNYDSIDIEAVYAKQRETLKEVISSEKLAYWYIQFMETKEHKGIRYLLKGHLMSKTEFTYTHEQHATYFYENTAPQWLVFNNGPKRDIERRFRRYMLRQKTRHLVVSGTFMVSSPLNSALQRCPVYLSLPGKIPVPEYFWRMDYDLNKKTGIVFVGYNGPWKAYETIKQCCVTTPCPHRLKRNFYTRDYFYCCTKESFEDSFGKFDPVIFEQY